MYSLVTSFSDLRNWLDSLPNQQLGRASAICETGDAYRVFAFYGLSRPGDEAIVERAVAEQMSRSLNEYFGSRPGRIYWRIPLETEITDHEAVARFDDNGPDRDFSTDRRCVLDRNWRLISCYCRLFRSAEKSAGPILAEICKSTNWQQGVSHGA